MVELHTDRFRQVDEMTLRSSFSRLLFALWLLVTGIPQSAWAQTLVGFTLATTADDNAIATDTVIVFYEGEIVSPMAENLAEIGKRVIGRFKYIVLDLNSPGGQLDHTAKAVTVLREWRRDATLRTRVRHGQRCLSACVIVFMQGVERIAGGASAWLFHGPCPRYTNIPSPRGTERYIAMLQEAGVGEGLLCELISGQYLSQPGKFWLSGFELFHRKGAGVITELLHAWQPEAPVVPPFDPQLRPR
jgi:hypothetical protein